MISAFICVYLRLEENSGSMAKTVNGCIFSERAKKFRIRAVHCFQQHVSVLGDRHDGRQPRTRAATTHSHWGKHK